MNNPKQISKFIIGDRGTESLALRNHKAFLFSRSKNLLVIPVLLAEVKEEKYSGRVPPNACGEYVWQGAYVFHISLSDGLAFRKSEVTHIENNTEPSNWRCRSFPYFVKRSLYIDNVLYTISDGSVKMNNLEDLI